MLLALFGALAIGASLGLIGSGGSILTLPVLLMMQRPDKLAIAESLAIVGSIALMGSTPYAIRGQVHWKSVGWFGLAGILGAYLGAFASQYVSSTLQLTLFACMMLIAAVVMFFGTQYDLIGERHSVRRLMISGFLVGCLTGILGVGGGFLIVPALVLFGSLPMRLAIGTSLVIIAMNSLIGFMGQWRALSLLNLHVEWEIVAWVGSIGVLGSFCGSFFGSKLCPAQLRRVFAAFVFLIGIGILMREL